MVHWTSYLFIKGMSLWNTLTDWISTVTYYTTDFSKYILDYFHKDHSTWYLLPEHSLPISHKYVKNTISPRWKYYASTRQLEQMNPSSPIYHSSLDWLSATLSITSHRDSKIDEHSMDELVQQLRIVSDGSCSPTLRELFLLWCVDTHHWFSGEDHIEFHIIDSNGEFKSYELDDPSLSFVTINTKLRIAHVSENCT